MMTSSSHTDERVKSVWTEDGVSDPQVTREAGEVLGTGFSHKRMAEDVTRGCETGKKVGRVVGGVWYETLAVNLFCMFHSEYVKTPS